MSQTVGLPYLYYKATETESGKTMTADEFKADILPYYKDMWRMAYAILGSREEASDAVQEAMLKLWSSRDTISQLLNPRTYCIGSARNMALRLKEQRRETVVPEVLGDTSDTREAEKKIETTDMSNVVRETIDNMPPVQSEVMQMSAFCGMSNIEIAEATGLTQDNVRTILSRGRKKLKTLFSKHF